MPPASVGDALVPALDGLREADLDTRIELAHALLSAPVLPSASALMRAVAVLDEYGDSTLRSLFYRSLLRLPNPSRTLAALRARRPRETNPLAALTADLVAARLGGGPERAAAEHRLSRIDAEDVMSVMDDVYAIGRAPELAPLFASWLDDRREAGTLGHRSTQNYRIHDIGVWAVVRLGVPVEGAPAHLTHADDGMRRAARRALGLQP